MDVDMACFHPMAAWRVPKENGGSGHLHWLSTPEDFILGPGAELLKIPCGTCIGCRIDRSKQWALRCVLEAKSHTDNSFITLTYDNDHLPSDGSLNFDDLTKFFKRFRKHFNTERIRYYAVGEYGAKLARPHYHIIVFGFDFGDKWLWSFERRQRLYRSLTLERLWPFGFSTIGSVTFESCAYVARYVQKKLIGGSRDEIIQHYGGRVPEAARMSRRPGIANEFFHTYQGDIYPKDFITFNGKKYKPGRYFDMLYQKEHPDEMLQVKIKRLEVALEKIDDCTPERLAARELVQNERCKRLVRGFETGVEDLKK